MSAHVLAIKAADLTSVEMENVVATHLVGLTTANNFKNICKISNNTDMEIIISFTLIRNISTLIYKMSRESAMKKIAKNDFEAAIYDLSSLHQEKEPRECLNRALVHLETAYFNYTKKIWTWDPFDTDAVLLDQKTFANDICLLIAIIHHILGNNDVARKWLIEKLKTKGSIHFPSYVFEGLSIPDEDSFYREICKNDYTILQNLISQSEENYDAILRERDARESWNDLHRIDV